MGDFAGAGVERRFAVSTHWFSAFGSLSFSDSDSDSDSDRARACARVARTTALHVFSRCRFTRSRAWERAFASLAIRRHKTVTRPFPARVTCAAPVDSSSSIAARTWSGEHLQRRASWTSVAVISPSRPSMCMAAMRSIQTPRVDGEQRESRGSLSQSPTKKRIQGRLRLIGPPVQSARSRPDGRLVDGRERRSVSQHPAGAEDSGLVGWMAGRTSRGGSWSIKRRPERTDGRDERQPPLVPRTRSPLVVHKSKSRKDHATHGKTPRRPTRRNPKQTERTRYMIGARSGHDASVIRPWTPA